MELDIGNKIAELLEKLAVNIGTTTDKVFPWFVKQQVIEGYVFLAIIIVIIGTFLIVSLLSFKKADFNNNDLNPSAYVFLTSTVILGISIFISVVALSEAITRITNPEYHGFKELINMLNRLLD